MSETELFRSGERAVFSLRSLYKRYGYLPFKMSKFEEYDLYRENKQFLIGDSVITFNDTDGRLLALKPDVTLSIIKNASYQKGTKDKVYYNENVYRVSKKTHRFKEIMQAGVECIGDIDILDTYEAISLALKSLSLLSRDFVLDISHLGILSSVIEKAHGGENFKVNVMRLLAEKNKHEILSLCREYGVESRYAETISSLVDMYGASADVLPKLKTLSLAYGAEEPYLELENLMKLLYDTDLASHIRIDFSVVNDMDYYDGIVFRGFLSGIPEGVLSGGEYGLLMKKMGKNTEAVGFAIYLDMLEELSSPVREYDVDVLMIYGDNTPQYEVLKKKEELLTEGKSVSAQRAIPEKLRYREIVKLD